MNFAVFLVVLLGLTGCPPQPPIIPDPDTSSTTTTGINDFPDDTSDETDTTGINDFPDPTDGTDTNDFPDMGSVTCGDGVVEGDEECDDANLAEFDSCTTQCLVPVPPELALSFSQIKQFEFSWAPVFGAEYYQLLESSDEGQGFVQVGGDIVDESFFGLEVPLHFRLNASYKLLACDADGCLESAVVDVVGSLAEAVGYVKASNAGSTDSFARVALSADGNTLAVGAPGEGSNATGIGGNQADNSVFQAGAVYVFVRNGGVWSQQAYLKASNPGAGDFFGASVALSGDGNTLAASANYEDSNATGIGGNQADNSASNAGAVYMFVRNGGVWSQQAYVKASNTGSTDEFGFEVALSEDGNTLAVGADWEDSNATGIGGNQADNSISAAGAVYVFVRNGGVWSQQAYAKASNPGTGDFFGWSVELSGDGNTLAVGAYRESSSATGIGGNQADNSAPDAGAVYVFVRNGGVWSQQAYIKASNTSSGDDFGYRMALSEDGNTLAVGGRYDDSNATGISGNQADNSASQAGAVYVFVRNGAVWSQQAYIKASNTGAGDYFGFSVALSGDGNILAVSAPFEDSNATGLGGNQADNSASDAGAVYVYVRNGGVWSQRAYVKASNAGLGDAFGWSAVALSGDGNTLAVGAIAEDSSAVGLGGNQADDSVPDAGAVYLY